MQRLLLILALTFFISKNLFAQWSIDAAVDDTVCNALGWQGGVQIVSDGKGGAFISWIDARNDLPEIYAQWVDKNGVNRWTTNGINLGAVSSEPYGWYLFDAKSDSVGGMLVTTGFSVERIDSNDNILWSNNLSQQFPISSFDVTADGNGGAGIIFLSSFVDSIYFVHLNSTGINVTPGGAQKIVNTPWGPGKIILMSKDTFLIAENTYANKLFIALTDSNGITLSSDKTQSAASVELLRNGFFDDAYLAITESEFAIGLYRIKISPVVSLAEIVHDESCGYTDYTAEIYFFIASDTNNIYLTYDLDAMQCSNYKIVRCRYDGSNQTAFVFYDGLESEGCIDGDGGFYRQGGNLIYHFLNSDSDNYSEVKAFTNLGETGVTGSDIISDGNKGCLIGFSKAPSKGAAALSDVYCKHYPLAGLVDTLAPVIDSLYTFVNCGSWSSITANTQSCNAEFYWYQNNSFLDSTEYNSYGFNYANDTSIQYFQCIAKNSFGADTAYAIFNPSYFELGYFSMEQSGDSLIVTAPGVSDYQWYIKFDTWLMPLNGSTNSFYIPDSPGYYVCQIHYPDGCYQYPGLYFEIPTSVNLSSAANEISTYPNPTFSELNVLLSSGKSEVSIFDIFGRKLFTQQTSETKLQLNLSSFASGFYFLRVTQNNFSSVKKFEISK